jgi:hypothetical protein
VVDGVVVSLSMASQFPNPRSVMKLSTSSIAPALRAVFQRSADATQMIRKIDRKNRRDLRTDQGSMADDPSHLRVAPGPRQARARSDQDRRAADDGRWRGGARFAGSASRVLASRLWCGLFDPGRNAAVPISAGAGARLVGDTNRV